MKKILSLFTTACFLISSVFSQPLNALVDAGNMHSSPDALPPTLIVSPKFGRVTDWKDLGSRQLVVNIQDLHCHPEVQRNISHILSSLDEKYRLNKVYVEGGYGEIDTSWLNRFEDAAVRNDVIESMVDQGKLTGGEYYSVRSNRPRLLRGLEDEAVHKANIVRLGRILEKKPLFEKQLARLEKDLELMKVRYFGPENRSFNALVERHDRGDIATEKYYRLLFARMRRINRFPDRYNNVFPLQPENYPNMQAFLEFGDLSAQIQPGILSRQLQQFVRLLKTKLSYAEYNTLLERTGNFTDLNELGATLAGMENARGLAAGFPEVAKFLACAEKNRSLNPVEMVREEKRLAAEIRIGFARNVNEQDVSFLAGFYPCFRDFLLNKLSAEDYEYFEKRFDTFRRVWGKYVFRDRVAEMSPDFELLAEFYRTNCRRNACFMDNMTLDAARGTEAAAGTPGELLKRSEIAVVITGGFHTDGLKKLLREKDISYLCITPNVTRDTTASDALYSELARQQSALFASNSLQLAIESVLSGDKKLAAVASALLARALKLADLDTLKPLVEQYMESDERVSEPAVTIDKQKKVMTIQWRDENGQERRIRVGENERFGRERREKPWIGRIMQYEDTKNAQDAAVNMLTLPLATLNPGKFMIRILTTINGFLNGRGLLWEDDLVLEVAANRELQDLIHKHSGIDVQELGQMFPWIQHVNAAQAQAEEDVRRSAEQQSLLLMIALLAVPQIHDLVVSVNAGRILAQSLSISVVELPRSRDEEKFGEAHRGFLDTYFPVLAGIRDKGLKALADINRSVPVIRLFRNLAFHTFWTAKYWGTPAALTIDSGIQGMTDMPRALKHAEELIAEGKAGLAGGTVGEVMKKNVNAKRDDALNLVQLLIYKKQVKEAGEFLVNMSKNGGVFQEAECSELAGQLIEGGQAGLAGEFLVNVSKIIVFKDQATVLGLIGQLIDGEQAGLAGGFVGNVMKKNVSFSRGGVLNKVGQLMDHARIKEAGEFLVHMSENGGVFEPAECSKLAGQLIDRGQADLAGTFLVNVSKIIVFDNQIYVFDLVGKLIDRGQAGSAGAFAGNAVKKNNRFEIAVTFGRVNKLLDEGREREAGEFLVNASRTAAFLTPSVTLDFVKKLIDGGQAALAGKFAWNVAKISPHFRMSDTLELVQGLFNDQKVKEAGEFLANVNVMEKEDRVEEAERARLARQLFEEAECSDLAKQLIKGGQAGLAGQFLMNVSKIRVFNDRKDVMVLVGQLINNGQAGSAGEFIENVMERNIYFKESLSAVAPRGLILPGNLTKVLQWKLEGVTDAEIALRIARLELIPSLNPAKYIAFFREHSRYYQQDNFGRALGTAAMWTVTTVRFLTGLIGTRSAAAARAAAYAAQTAFHTKWDLPVIGQMKVGVIHIGDTTAAAKDEGLVVHKSCADAREAVELIKNAMGTDMLGSSIRGKERFDGCVVTVGQEGDVAGVKRALSDAGINKVPVVLTEETSATTAEGRNAALQRLLNEHQAMSYLFGENVGVKADEDLINALRVHNRAVNSDLYIDANTLSPKMRAKIEAMAAHLRQCGVLVHVIENGKVQVGSEKEKKDVVEFILGSDRQTDPRFAGKVLEIVIPEGMTGAELKDAIAQLDLSQKMMFRASEIREAITRNKDIFERDSFVSFFNSVVNLGQKKIRTPAEAKSFGRNWSLPLLEGDQAMEEIRLLNEKDFDGLKKLDPKALTPAVVQALVEEMGRLESEELKQSFIEGLLVRALITAKLREKDKQFALEYAARQYKINALDEAKLGDALLARFLQPDSITGDLDIILNRFVADWRMSKPFRKDGLGNVDVESFKAILSAA